MKTQETHRSRPQQSIMQQGMELSSYSQKQLLLRIKSHLALWPPIHVFAAAWVDLCICPNCLTPRSFICRFSTSLAYRGLYFILNATASMLLSASEIVSFPALATTLVLIIHSR